MSVYVFKGTVMKSSRRYLIYPPVEYQERLKKLRGKKVYVVVIEECA